MKLPRDLSGRKLAGVLCSHFGYLIIHQVGSHIVLESNLPAHHRLAIPDHHSLRIGTLNSILRSVARANEVDKSKILTLLKD